MSYPTEYEIKLSVTDGPAIDNQKSTLPKEFCTTDIVEVGSKRILIKCQTTTGAQPSTITLPTLVGNQIRGFVTVKADRYTYKDNCGKDMPAIRYWKNGSQAENEVLDGPHVYVNRPLQSLDVQSLSFEVCDDFFGCLKPDEKEVTVTVTYGIAVPYDKCTFNCQPCGAIPAADPTPVPVPTPAPYGQSPQVPSGT